jgi:hypothetical protein
MVLSFWKEISGTRGHADQPELLARCGGSGDSELRCEHKNANRAFRCLYLFYKVELSALSLVGVFRFGRIVALYAIVTNPFGNDQPDDNATAEGRYSE